METIMVLVLSVGVKRNWRQLDSWDVNKFGLYIRCNSLIFEERINRKWGDENLIRIQTMSTQCMKKFGRHIMRTLG